MIQTIAKNLPGKAKSKKGFTLAELLIVVAIIAVLVAIAIPVFTSSLDKAENAVEAANFRSAKAQAMVDYLTTGTAKKTQTYTYVVDEKGNIALTRAADATTEGPTNAKEGTVIITEKQVQTTP